MMLTGTPLDLTPFGILLSAGGWLYWSVVATLAYLAGRSGTDAKVHYARALTVVAVFSLPLFIQHWIAESRAQQRKARLAESLAYFNSRCESAGESIKRTASNVEGIVLLRPRTEIPESDQFVLNDPYGGGCVNLGCVETYLFGYTMVPDEQGKLGLHPEEPRIYQYVDTPLGEGEKYTRYTRDSPRSKLVATIVTGQERARYGVTWADISTRTDREHWVAGGSLTVVDLATSEVIAERVGYVVDRGLGDTAGFRSPWAFAKTRGPSCPPASQHNSKFVTKVLKPK
jgi:hypothetical protein